MARSLDSLVWGTLALAALAACSSSKGSARLDGAQPDAYAPPDSPAADAFLAEPDLPLATPDGTAPDVFVVAPDAAAPDLVRNGPEVALPDRPWTAPDVASVPDAQPASDLTIEPGDDITGRWTERLPFGYLTANASEFDTKTSRDYGQGVYSASFYSTHPSPCSFQVVSANCVYRHCPAAGLVYHAEAGLIYLWVNGRREYQYEMNGTAHLYQVDTTVMDAWNVGGLPLKFEGGWPSKPTDTSKVPPFSAELTSTTRLFLTQPALPSSLESGRVPLVVPRTQPLAVAWSGTSAGSVRITISQPGGNATNHAICRFDPAPGSAQVPPEILGMLSRGAATLLVETAFERIVEVEAWRLLVAATTNAVLPTKYPIAPEIELR